MRIETFGSVCSGIEAASLVLSPQGARCLWLSEVNSAANAFLSLKYPETPNAGDLNGIPGLVARGEIEAPDLLVGGTPCQSFSVSGARAGLDDWRGRLSLRYIETLDEIDKERGKNGKGNAVFMWENVEGVLSDSGNAFGCFLAGLLGLNSPVIPPEHSAKKKGTSWPRAGIIANGKRTIAWRVLDAKYFGLPQQRRRLYVVGGPSGFRPQDILLEKCVKIPENPFKSAKNGPRELKRVVKGHEIEIFRAYTDCLYASYGTKWTGNAASVNGSLFVIQDGRLRRLTPLECERIMGFPDNYTLRKGVKYTQKYRETGNSWAVNVVRWITERIIGNGELPNVSETPDIAGKDYALKTFNGFERNGCGFINASSIPNDPETANMLDFIDTDADERLYISEKGCAGLLKRNLAKPTKMPRRLEEILIEGKDGYPEKQREK